jgi:hypothetical protein
MPFYRSVGTSRDRFATLYDYIYRLTSGAVHFNPRVLFRTGWGKPIMHFSIPQRLTIHAADLGSFFPRAPIQHRGDRQQSPRLRGVLHSRRQATKLPAGIVPPRILKQATIVELENNPAELSKALTARTIDALGANRQRLTTLSKATPGTRLLADDLFNVPQNIVVPKNRPAALAAVNALIDEVRASGVLQSAIERGGAIGVAVAPAGVKAGCPG